MTIAEIRRKISRSGSNLSDTMEDLLTSDVFGPLRYLPPELGLVPILKRSRSIEGKSIEMPLQGPCEVKFWPKLQHCEPDVLIEFPKSYALIMIEAKYLSGKSSVYRTVNVENESGVEKLAVSDQLQIEYRALVDEAKDFEHYCLLYVTAHRTLPRDELEESCRDESKSFQNDFRNRTFWLSWMHVGEEIERLLALPEIHDNAQSRAILEDMLVLLQQKGFKHFTGFTGGKSEVHPFAGRAFYLSSKDQNKSP